MTRRILSTVILLCVAAAQEDGPSEPLCRAARNGDLVQVRTLLTRGANPDTRDEQNDTPLMWTASAHALSSPDDRKGLVPDYEGVAKLLLDRGADVNARNGAGRTALMMAMEGSASEYRVVGADDSMARLLFARGANVNARDDAGWTSLLKVLNLWADQQALIEFLVSKGANINARLNDGRTGLMLAARLGKDDRVRFLIAKGADVNARDMSGVTVLMLAATIQRDEQSFNMMELLRKNGANLNDTDDQGRTAADRAAQSGYLDRVKLLIDSGTKVADPARFMKRARDYALLRAIAERNLSTAKTMLGEGADPDFHDDQGRTLLMIAANDEYSAARTTLLLERGASVNFAGAGGDTALMVAADRYQPEIVKTLLDHGADPNAADRDGNTVLMRAAASKYSWQEERKPLIRFLLEKGADPAAKNGHGVTALMLMALNGNPALPLLLEKPLDVNARDHEGNTALLYASRYFVRDWQRRNGWALLGKGADVNAANHNGETALILAATQSEADAARLLLEKGAQVNAKTNGGRTALMQAIDGPKEFDNGRHAVYSPQIAKLLIASGADVNAKDAGGNSAWTIAKNRGYDDMLGALEKAGAKP
jgi:ankyrin repeat protein